MYNTIYFYNNTIANKQILPNIKMDIKFMADITSNTQIYIDYLFYTLFDNLVRAFSLYYMFFCFNKITMWLWMI